MKLLDAGLAMFIALAAAVVPAYAGSPVAFEAASMKVAAGGPRKTAVQNDRLDFANVSLRDLILHAYRIEAYQLSGPSWMANQTYNIIAKLPAGAPHNQIPEMLQTLLEERLKLKVHHQSKEMAVYALLVAKGGPRLKKAEDSTSPALAGTWQMRMADSTTVHVVIPRASMLTLTRFLTTMTHRPVLDQTAIDGEYDIELDGKVTPVEAPPQSDSAAPPLPPPPPTSMDVTKGVQGLGLRLEARRAPADLLVVDSADKTPAGN